MSAKLYVGNLSYDTTETAVEEAFKPHGEVVSVTLINDRDTGRPKGFGFVEMATDEAAEAARVALDGTQLGGRTIKVDIAKEREPAAAVAVVATAAAAVMVAAAVVVTAAAAAVVAGSPRWSVG